MAKDQKILDEQQIAAALKQVVELSAEKSSGERDEIAKRILKPIVGRLWYVLAMPACDWPNDVLDWCDYVLNDRPEPFFNAEGDDL